MILACSTSIFVSGFFALIPEPETPPREANNVELPFDKDDLHLAAIKANRGKSPGNDGLPLEFYLKTCSDPPPSQSGPRNKIKSYRPVSLINIDARILHRAINDRLLTYLGVMVGRNVNDEKIWTQTAKRVILRIS
ncbi:hypothetical protein BDY24DRAFT_416478 [Mrakia frigida]|uniref:uncharacterized protein n=1 Tax=Mrakia frigida TaxID=29902 RepID=UPI003FCC0B39